MFLERNPRVKGMLLATLVLASAISLLAFLLVRNGESTDRWLPGLSAPVENRVVDSPLSFELSTFDFTSRPVLQGEVITIENAIRNHTNATQTVESLTGNCGCTQFRIGPEPMKFPFHVPPRGKVTFVTEINTRTRGGFQQFVVLLRGRCATNEIPSQTMAVNAHVRVPFIAVPTETYLTFEADEVAKPQAHVVTLYDDWPGPPLEINEITCTAPERLTWKISPLAGEEIVGVTKLKKRYALAASYRPAPGVEDFNETITIVPSDPRATPLKLRIWGKVHQPYSILPRELVFHNASPSPTRFLFYQFRKPEFEEIRIAALPPFLKGEVKSPSAGRTQLAIECEYPAEAGKHWGEIVLETGPTRAQIKVPVTVYVER